MNQRVFAFSARGPLMRVITDAKTKHLKQKAACSFVQYKNWKEEPFKDILFKEKPNKESDRKER